MTTIRVNLDVTQYVRVTSDPLTPSSLLLQSHRDTVRIAFSDVKPSKGNTVFHELGGEHPPLTVQMTEQAAWALAMTERSALTVTQQRLPIEISASGGISGAVTRQSQTTDMLDLLFLQEKVTGLTLGADTTIDSRVITLAIGHGLTDANSKGHIIELAHVGDNHFYQGEVLSIVGDDVTCAPPLNDIYEIATTTIATGNPNMVQDTATGIAIDGSVTPVIFTVKPLTSQAGDISRIVMASTSTNDSDMSTFGGAPALDVGMTLRAKRSDGTFKNLFTYRTNFDLALHGAGDINPPFAPKGGNTTHGLIARITFEGEDKHNAAVRLDGFLDEELQIVIFELMDNTATGNLTLSFIAEGSELQE